MVSPVNDLEVCTDFSSICGTSLLVHRHDVGFSVVASVGSESLIL